MIKSEKDSLPLDGERFEKIGLNPSSVIPAEALHRMVFRAKAVIQGFEAIKTSWTPFPPG